MMSKRTANFLLVGFILAAIAMSVFLPRALSQDAPPPPADTQAVTWTITVDSTGATLETSGDAPERVVWQAWADGAVRTFDWTGETAASADNDWLIPLSVLAQIDGEFILQAIVPGSGKVAETTMPLTDPPTPAGAFIYRDAAGQESTMTQVVTSQQMEAVLGRLAAIEAQLTRIETALAAGGSTTPSQPPAADPTYVPINVATMAQLEAMPGIGSVKAGNILSARGFPDVAGYRPFADWNDLVIRVTGIGQGTVADLQAAGVVLDAPPDGQ